MHTELRALKRSEYDQQQREKERLALQQRRDLDELKQRREQEAIAQIRQQRHTFRSRPIKHYKPVEVKPSEKPLTEPVSPQLGTSLLFMHSVSHHNQQQQQNHEALGHTVGRLKSATSLLSLQHFHNDKDNVKLSQPKKHNGSMRCFDDAAKASGSSSTKARTTSHENLNAHNNGFKF